MTDAAAYRGVHPNRYLLKRWVVVERYTDWHFVLYGCWTHKGAARVVSRRQRKHAYARQWDVESGLRPMAPPTYDLLDMREHPARLTKLGSRQTRP